jgi:hypothetical protein
MAISKGMSAQGTVEWVGETLQYRTYVYAAVDTTYCPEKMYGEAPNAPVWSAHCPKGGVRSGHESSGDGYSQPIHPKFGLVAREALPVLPRPNLAGSDPYLGIWVTGGLGVGEGGEGWGSGRKSGWGACTAMGHARDPGIT